MNVNIKDTYIYDNKKKQNNDATRIYSRITVNITGIMNFDEVIEIIKERAMILYDNIERFDYSYQPDYFHDDRTEIFCEVKLEFIDNLFKKSQVALNYISDMIELSYYGRVIDHNQEESIICGIGSHC